MVIVCSSDDEEQNQIISKLHLYRRPYAVPTDLAKYGEYLEAQFKNEDQPSYQQVQEMENFPDISASIVDPDR